MDELLTVCVHMTDYDLDYVLDDQVGYKLRLANQRHLEIFADALPDLTPTQFSVMVRLYQHGTLSQNHLGREVGMNAATTKGVVERLANKGLVAVRPSETDRRRLLLSLTADGRDLIVSAVERAKQITERTLTNLNQRERRRLLELLDKL